MARVHVQKHVVPRYRIDRTDPRYRIYRIYEWLTWEQIQRLYGAQASTMVQGAKKELGSNDEWWYEVLVEIH